MPCSLGAPFNLPNLCLTPTSPGLTTAQEPKKVIDRRKKNRESMYKITTIISKRQIIHHKVFSRIWFFSNIVSCRLVGTVIESFGSTKHLN